MISFEIDVDTREALQRWKEAEGINVSEQLRRAVRAWLEQHGKLKGVPTKRTNRK
jgi:hypothetical protein